MFCTGLTRVDFVVWFGYHLPLYTETVKFDQRFWQKALPRLDHFYRRAFVPELFTRRIERGESLYQHGKTILRENVLKKAIFTATHLKKYYHWL